jgi:hypothetical protein
MPERVDQVCRTSYEDFDPDEVDDYDPTQTSEYQGGFEDGAGGERAKWLPLWEAVKGLEEFEYFESPYDEHEVAHDNARYELYRVILELRSQGEK